MGEAAFMETQDITAEYQQMMLRQQALGDAVESAVHLACASQPALEHAVLRLLAIDASAASPFRLLPMPVLGALSGDPEPALPICVLSRLWWAGAETLDDLMDGEFDLRESGLTRSAVTVASTACLTVLPQAVIGQQRFPVELEAAWNRELAEATMCSANGQLDDVDPSGDLLSWKQTIVSYAGKTGAAYARDVAMAASLAGAGTEELRGWRAFGRLFGVLRQTANDRSALTVEQDSDLANGTRTLLLAYAVETLPSEASQALLEAHARTRQDTAARRAVWEMLRRPEVAAGYNGRVDSIRWRLSTLLEQLAPPSRHRDVLQWMINVSAETSRLDDCAQAGTVAFEPASA
ncbi:polyprenyl synthetase family protein [Streptomyces olivaceoviridis]